MASYTSLPPVPPLPQPVLTHPLPGVSLLLPLSRRGTGPGLILLLPGLGRPILSIENGIPSPLMKWAEESYIVAAIDPSYLKSPSRAEELLSHVVKLLNENPACDLRDRIGLIGISATHLSLHEEYNELNPCSIRPSFLVPGSPNPLQNSWPQSSHRLCDYRGRYSPSGDHSPYGSSPGRQRKIPKQPTA